MPARKIISPKVPDPGVFSSCLVVGDQIFMSGMTASSPGGPIGGNDMFAQAKAALGKVNACLEAAGATMSDVVKMTVYVTDMSLRTEFGRARAEYFLAEPKPCSTLVEVRALAFPGLLVEVDVVAIRGASQA